MAIGRVERLSAILLVFSLLFSGYALPSAVADIDARDVGMTTYLDSLYHSSDVIVIPVVLTGLSIDEPYSLSWSLYADNATSGVLLIQGSESWISTTTSYNAEITIEKFYNGQLFYEIEFELFEDELKIEHMNEMFTTFQDILNPQYNGMFVFGDSLSDVGNTKDSLLNLPDTPPYYYGRFSDGPNWVDVTSAELGFQLGHGMGSSSGEVRAFGGAQTGQGYSFIVIPNVGTLINDFLVDVQSSFSANDLVVLWAGGNDFIYGTAEPNETLANMASHITQLAGAGAQTLLIPNLPPLEDTPEIQGRPQSEQLEMASKVTYYNSILATELAMLNSTLGINIISVDTHSIFKEIVSHKEHFGLVDINSPACVSSGSLLPLPICNSGDPVAPNVEEYLFFDKAHPTSTMHSIIAEFGLAALGTPDTDSDGISDNQDLCEWTPTNQTADINGCSWQQLDDDFDGILNGWDICPDTTEGDLVDEQGCSGWQKDSDSDGLLDAEDACPHSSILSVDYDTDGCMDYEDSDDDNDGILDVDDNCPRGELYWNSTSAHDNDADGCRDVSEDFDDDNDGLSDVDEEIIGTDPLDDDTDNDNVLDGDDAFPLDSTQHSDSDGDGYGDNPLGDEPDSHPDDPSQWNDGDGDGYGDNENGSNPDAFPQDSSQWYDQDGDGYGDQSDGTNPDGCLTIWGNSTQPVYGCPDSDGDGWADLGDHFPLNHTEWIDSDGDEVGDNSDDFPELSTQTTDSDGDGYGDNPHGVMPDSFPYDSNEWNDTDDDGVGDNSDQCDSPPFIIVDESGCQQSSACCPDDGGDTNSDAVSDDESANDNNGESGDYEYGESQSFFSSTSLIIVVILLVAILVVILQDKRGPQSP